MADGKTILELDPIVTLVGTDVMPVRQDYAKKATLDQVKTYMSQDPVLTGDARTPNVTAGNDTTKIANTAYVKTAIDAVINGAPANLNTLAEIAAAINNDPSFASTLATLLGQKSNFGHIHDNYAPKQSPAFFGTPTAPSPPLADSSDRIATTDFVKAVANILITADNPGKLIFPGGLCIQWGFHAGLFYGEANGAPDAVVTFPSRFTTVPFYLSGQIVTTSMSSSNDIWTVVRHAQTTATTGVFRIAASGSGASSANGVYWMAIGIIDPTIAPPEVTDPGDYTPNVGGGGGELGGNYTPPGGPGGLTEFDQETVLV